MSIGAECECFLFSEMYTINIRDMSARTTVYKRAVDKTYGLKIKASRVFFNEVNKRFPALPFTLRALADERSAKMGVRECVAHDLLIPYPVLYERPGDFIAHVKFTVLLLPGGTTKITGLDFPEGFEPAKDPAEFGEEIAALLNAADKKKKKKKIGKA